MPCPVRPLIVYRTNPEMTSHIYEEWCQLFICQEVPKHSSLASPPKGKRTKSVYYESEIFCYMISGTDTQLGVACNAILDTWARQRVSLITLNVTHIRVQRLSNTKPKQKINRDKADAKKKKRKRKKVTDRDSQKHERRLKMRGTVEKRIHKFKQYTVAWLEWKSTYISGSSCTVA